MRGAFIAFIRWYLTLKPWETSGRIYEWIGIKWVDAKLSAVFGEVPLPRYEPGSELPRAYVHNKVLRGQYSEVVNAMCMMIYLGLMLLCLVADHRGLAVWSIVLAFHHWIVLPIERYKRALVEEWLRHPEALTDDWVEQEEWYPRGEKELNHWYFAPKRFESEKFWDRIGVHSFRLFVFWLTRLAESISDSEAAQHAPNQLKSTDVRQLDKFERETRTSETVHLIGILEHLPFALVFLQKLYWPGLIYLLGMAYLNLYAIFLQRHHRVRLFKLLMRRAKRAQTNT